MPDIFHQEWYSFQTFGEIHLAVLICFFLSIWIIYLIGQSNYSPRTKKIIGIFLSTLPLMAVILRASLQASDSGRFDHRTELPLHLCRLVAFLVPLLYLKRSQVLFGLLYFSIMAGTLNAIITPDIDRGFPHWGFFLYWVLHGGLVLAILYQVFVHDYRPLHKNIWQSFFLLNIYLVIVHAVNFFIGSNYAYTMHKPPNPSLLDFFGPWPLYLIVIELIAVVIFYLAFLPFYLQDQRRASSSGKDKMGKTRLA